MAVDWDIKSRGESCHQCKKSFTEGESYYTALSFGEEGYERSDHCQACWKKIPAKESYISYWQGSFSPPAEKPVDPLQKENAETFLRQCIEENDPSKVNVVYILAIMLERKKVLIEKDIEERKDGTKIRIYQHRETEETFLILDPQLRLADLEPIQEEVVITLGGTPPKKRLPAEETTADAPSTDGSDDATEGKEEDDDEFDDDELDD